MTRNRFAVGVATVAFGLAMSVAPVAAQALPGPGCSEPCPPSGDTLPNTDVNTGNPGALPTNEGNTTGAPALAAPGADSGPRGAVADVTPGGLAVTGGDIVGLAAIGAGAVGLGTVLSRRGRRRTA